ncbi:hypothetical protein LOK49_LG12G02565 [Camellia lanceoleosa]|uniref:Uncharacterized protein n=1 Tax=Camellia lanceoleosa TaxID=1840588 RepID=A0ACC0FWX6_9ERIC|nr:hypothetical protein LOK49_LG12G02565 [Camellia lanceoleosa]
MRRWVLQRDVEGGRVMRKRRNKKGVWEMYGSIGFLAIMDEKESKRDIVEESRVENRDCLGLRHGVQINKERKRESLEDSKLGFTRKAHSTVWSNWRLLSNITLLRLSSTSEGSLLCFAVLLLKSKKC